jgi:nitrogenase molybdenum-iron protein beta chain
MSIHRNRNGCSLHGALKVLEAVDGFIPIVHSNAGCSLQSKLVENHSGISAGPHFRGWLETPGTAVFEKQIIFGGTARLREQIKNTVKVENGDLYVVVTGCAPEIVGDDTPAMVKEAQEQGFPVITVSAPGFKGSVYDGYVWTFKTIIEYIAHNHNTTTPQENLLNILGVVPKQDLFWEGNLQGLSTLLESVGLQSNNLFGYGETLDSWRIIPNAALNLVVSPWGLPVAQFLEEKFGTPFLYWGFLPVGVKDTTALLQELGTWFILLPETLTSVFQREEKRFNYLIQKVAQSYIKFDFQKEIALIGESSNIIGVSRFLQDSFGQIIRTIVITDHPDEELRTDIRQKLNINEEVDILFSSNEKEIEEKLREVQPELILGSSLEQQSADELSIPLVEISVPVYDQIHLQQTYIGYVGAINLVQDYAEAVLKHTISKLEWDKISH